MLVHLLSRRICATLPDFCLCLPTQDGRLAIPGSVDVPITLRGPRQSIRSREISGIPCIGRKHYCSSSDA